MAKNTYDIDITLMDGSTHRTCSVILTDEECAKCTALFAEMVALGAGCTAATCTKSAGHPMTFDGLRLWLDAQIPRGKAKLSNLNPGATKHNT